MADASATRAAVERVLASITLPDGETLVASGRIQSLAINGSQVGLGIAVEKAEASVMEPVRRSAEAALSGLPGIERALVALVEASPRKPAAAQKNGGLLSGLRRLGRAGAQPVAKEPAAPPQPAQSPAGAPQSPGGARAPRQGRPAGRTGPVKGVAKIIAVGSGKGGVGKSTVSFNLAVALARTGWRVGLLDADIYGPSVPTLVGAQDHKPSGDKGFAPFEASGIKAMSIGFLVPAEKAVVWRGPMVTGALNQLLRDTAWGTLDCLIIDMPPGTGDIQLSLAQQTPLTGAVVVTTPQDLALLDVRKAMQMFGAVNVPILGMVENMSAFVCPKCGEVTAIFGEGGGEREAQAAGVPFLGRIPLTMAIREAADAGRPVADGSGLEGAAYRQIADTLRVSLSETQAKPFPKIIFEE
ncbi:MAG: P-loop NTPase [Pseudomonadota bacterium]